MLRKGFFAVLLLLVFAFAAQAKTLVVLMDQDFAPYSMKQGDTQTGIDVEVFREAARRTGLQYRLEPLPWPTLMNRVESGQCDMAFSVFHTPERDSKMTFVMEAPIHKSDYALFTLISKGIQKATVSDLQSMTVGRPKGYSIGKSFDDAEAAGALKTVGFPSDAKMIAALLAGQIDAFVGQVDVVQYSLKRMGLQSTVVQIQPNLRRGRPAFLVVSKSVPIGERQSLAKRFGMAIKSIYEDGTYREIARKYLLRF